MDLDTAGFVAETAQEAGRGQHGQSVVEALLVLTVLGSLGVAVAWLGRLQDVDLQLQHASRRVAFAQAHQELDFSDLSKGVDGYLGRSGPAWRDRQGAAFLRGATGADITMADTPFDVRFQNEGIAPQVQVADPLVGADRWRAEFHLGDSGVWRSQVSVQTSGDRATSGALRDFDGLSLRLQRHTAILRGSGAAASDGQVQDRLSASREAWGRWASESQRQGRAVQQRLQGVDEAWGRSQPGWDWVRGWAGQVPPRSLQPWSQP